MQDALLTTCLGDLPLIARGKVRDIYALGDALLFIASDRISAFDHVLGSGIPDKGRILTQISAFWFHFLSSTVPNHILAISNAEIAESLVPYSAQIFGGSLPAALIAAHPLFAEQIAGRSMVVRRAEMFPIECVVRGYLSGSGWKDYRATGAVCGIALPAGLRESDRLPEPIFTPAAKINTGGHDENISYAQVESAVDPDTAAKLRDLTLAIYAKASAYAATKGLILADTKFEFGAIAHAGQTTIVLADEVLTPDSSRYWDVAHWQPGTEPVSFDKQYVRNWLDASGWDHQSPPPPLPADVVSGTFERYREAFVRLTGREPEL